MSIIIAKTLVRNKTYDQLYNINDNYLTKIINRYNNNDHLIPSRIKHNLDRTINKLNKNQRLFII